MTLSARVTRAEPCWSSTTTQFPQEVQLVPIPATNVPVMSVDVQQSLPAPLLVCHRLTTQTLFSHQIGPPQLPPSVRAMISRAWPSLAAYCVASVLGWQFPRNNTLFSWFCLPSRAVGELCIMTSALDQTRLWPPHHTGLQPRAGLHLGVGCVLCSFGRRLVTYEALNFFVLIE